MLTTIRIYRKHKKNPQTTIQGLPDELADGSCDAIDHQVSGMIDDIFKKGGRIVIERNGGAG